MQEAVNGTAARTSLQDSLSYMTFYFQNSVFCQRAGNFKAGIVFYTDI